MNGRVAQIRSVVLRSCASVITATPPLSSNVTKIVQSAHRKTSTRHVSAPLCCHDGSILQDLHEWRARSVVKKLQKVLWYDGDFFEVLSHADREQLRHSDRAPG